MVRKVFAIALLAVVAAVAACSGNITASEDEENRGGGIYTSGG